MRVRIRQQHIDEHREQGITVLRGAVPPALVDELRQQARHALELAISVHGKQAQRIQPVAQYPDTFDRAVFERYVKLPELNEAVRELLGPDAEFSDLGLLGILVGPPARTNCMQYHMDVSERTAGVDPERLRQIRLQPGFGNQVNCPLYEDAAFWYVPGSHARPIDEGSMASANSPQWFELLEKLLDTSTPHSGAGIEMDCLSYLKSMPGACRYHLEPGDFAIYRPFGWHAAFYSQYQRRATLHHGVWTAAARAWWQEMNEVRGPWLRRYERPASAPAATDSQAEARS